MSRNAVGSSSSITRAPWAIARATGARRRSPPEISRPSAPPPRGAGGSPTGSGSACSFRPRWDRGGSSPLPGKGRRSPRAGCPCPRSRILLRGRTAPGSRPSPVASEQMEKEGRAGERGDRPHRQLPRGGRDAGKRVGEDEERAAQQERRRQEAGGAGSHPHPRRGGNDDPDEAEEPRARDDRAGQQRRREVRRRLHPLHGEPRLERRVIAEEEQVQAAGEQVQEDRAERDVREEARDAAGGSQAP